MTALPTGPCPSCATTVLACADPTRDDAWTCLHCAAALAEVQFIDEDALDALGYGCADVFGVPVPERIKSGGCGGNCGGPGGCGSCSSRSSCAPDRRHELLTRHRH